MSREATRKNHSSCLLLNSHPPPFSLAYIMVTTLITTFFISAFDALIYLFDIIIKYYVLIAVAHRDGVGKYFDSPSQYLRFKNVAGKSRHFIIYLFTFSLLLFFCSQHAANYQEYRMFLQSPFAREADFSRTIEVFNFIVSCIATVSIIGIYVIIFWSIILALKYYLPLSREELLFDIYQRKMQIDTATYMEEIYDPEEVYTLDPNNDLAPDLRRRRVHRGTRRIVAVALAHHLTRFTNCGKGHFLQLRDISWNWFAESSPHTKPCHKNVILAHALKLLMEESPDFALQQEYQDFVGKLGN